jgi:protein-S-isoprenylcysteine O-methyltransferase Ste14
MAVRLLRWTLVLAAFVWIAMGIGLARFWIFGAILLATALYASSAVDPTLFRERRRPAGPTIDRAALRAIRLIAGAQFVVAILDISRFHWSDSVPASVRAAAMIVFAASVLLVARAMIANRFFSSAIRLQTDRGHEVVSEGPYSVVRHPGYLGMIVTVPAGALALGSWWAFAIALAYSALIARRVSIEDRYLHEHLDGYPAYATRVRYRLLPGVW